MHTPLAPSSFHTHRSPRRLLLAASGLPVGLLAACGAEPPALPAAVAGDSCPSAGWCWQRGRPLTVDGDRARGLVYALGAEGAFLRWEHDRFVATPVPTPRTLLSAWLRSPDDAWVSDAAGGTWRLDGASWRAVEAPAPVHRIFGGPDGSLWAKAGGSASAHGGTSAARLLREQGGRWVEAMEPFPYCLGGDFTLAPSGQIWSAGLVCSGAGTVEGMEVHRFDGAGWQRVGERIAGQAWFPSFVPGTERVRVRAQGTFEWDGAGWRRVEPPAVPQMLPADQQALWDGLDVLIVPSALGCEGAYRLDARQVFCFGYGQIHRQVGTDWQATLADPFAATQGPERWGRVPPALWAGGHVLHAWGSGPADVYRTRLDSRSRLEHFDGAAWAVALDAGVDVVDVAGAGRGEVWALTAGGLHRSDGSRFTAVPVPAELDAGELSRLLALGGGAVLVLGERALLRYDGGWTVLRRAPTSWALHAVAGSGARDLWLSLRRLGRSNDAALERFDGERWAAVPVTGLSRAVELFSRGGETWLATAGSVQSLGGSDAPIASDWDGFDAALWVGPDALWLTTARQARRLPRP